MLLGFKTELNPNKKQATSFMKHCGAARHAWNQGLRYTQLLLDINRLAKKSGNSGLVLKFPSAIDLHKWLVAEVKPENPWYYECSKCVGQYALRALRDAWDRCFKKVSKAPRFKKKGKHDSFTLDGAIHVKDFKIKLPRIGWVRVFERLPAGVKPKNVTVSRDGDRWFVSFKLEVEPEPTEKTNLSVGVDFGARKFAVLSNGEVFKAPMAEYKRLKSKLSKLQYLSRNKKKGSNRWRKAMYSIQRLHYRIKCLRRDFIHKFTTYLAKNFQIICIEDLNVSGLVKNSKLAEIISMQGWYEARRQLEYKCKLYGSELRVIGRFEPSSKLHFRCGWRNDELGSSEVFYCPKCNETLDRDLNASLNIERLGVSLTS